MKKFTFILAALFAVTFANAQIIKEHSFTSVSGWTSKGLPFYPCSYINLQSSTNDRAYVNCAQELPCSFYMNYTENNYRIKDITFINPQDYSIYKTLDLSTYNLQFSYSHLCAIAYDIFAIDKIALIIRESSSPYDYIILDEDGTELMRIDNYYQNDHSIIIIERINDQWKLIVPTASSEDRRTLSSIDIYSLPGDGSEPSPSQAISNTSSPKHSARKIVREGQVFVETDTNTFDLRGQEVK